jgi:chromosome segregation ATPase
MDDSSVPGGIESRLEKLEKEMQGLRKFVTTLETGHEARANAWNKKLALLTKQIEELTERLRKTKKRVKKLKH